VSASESLELSGRNRVQDEQRDGCVDGVLLLLTAPRLKSPPRLLEMRIYLDTHICLLNLFVACPPHWRSTSPSSMTDGVKKVRACALLTDPQQAIGPSDFSDLSLSTSKSALFAGR
jgi:hypothetical protein